MQKVLGFIPLPVIYYLGAFIIAALSGKQIISYLRKLNFGQVVREEGPKSHKIKSGTPTMGAFIFLLPLLVLGAIYSFYDVHILPIIIVTFLFGLIGFIDDYLKVVKKNNKGLSPTQKMVGLLLVSGVFTWYAQTYIPGANNLVIPFLGIHKPIVMPLFIAVPFSLFVLVAFTNAVNLTDGLDGLCGTVTTIVLLFFSLVSMFNSNWDYVQIFSSILAGGILGFLVFNMHPAKVFMGDTGSLALGGALAAISIVTGTPIFLGLAGIIYVIETLSVMIQVYYYKRTRKRVFLMAPIHHHFEHKGWSEIKVVAVFGTVTFIMSILAFILLR